jgi:hypothetical protein
MSVTYRCSRFATGCTPPTLWRSVCIGWCPSLCIPGSQLGDDLFHQYCSSKAGPASSGNREIHAVLRVAIVVLPRESTLWATTPHKRICWRKHPRSTNDANVTIPDPHVFLQGSLGSIATTPNAFSRTGSGTAEFSRSQRDRQAHHLLLSTRDLVRYQGQFSYVVPSEFDLEHPNIVEVFLLPIHAFTFQNLEPWSGCMPCKNKAKASTHIDMLLIYLCAHSRRSL